MSEPRMAMTGDNVAPLRPEIVRDQTLQEIEGVIACDPKPAHMRDIE